ncbi:hypothetical protein GCM10007916_02570 [Psychromonas marina]|uniref:Uncharacterized protein n=1 Tax=Psychromonas marina TaxID=88364 RepID=A0ABQ6DW45_9GAMM|nr:hypothetical protein [Psychromonas marina]GLS89190.1 hypothetical protein GCM10007916_02570 [Psychromonas marina]
MHTRCRHCEQQAEIAKLSDGLCHTCLGQPTRYLDTLKRIAESAPVTTFLLMLSLFSLFTLPWGLQILPWAEVAPESVLSNVGIIEHIMVSVLLIFALSVQLLLTYVYRFVMTDQKVMGWKAFLISLTLGLLSILIIDCTKVHVMLPTLILLANFIIFPFFSYAVLRVPALRAEEPVVKSTQSDGVQYPAAKTSREKLNACYECNNPVGFFKLKDRLCNYCYPYEWALFEHAERLIKEMPWTLGLAIGFMLMGTFASEQPIMEYYSTHWFNLITLLLPLLAAFVIRFYIARCRLPVLVAFIISIVLFINPSITALFYSSSDSFIVVLPLFVWSTYKTLIIAHEASS